MSEKKHSSTVLNYTKCTKGAEADLKEEKDLIIFLCEEEEQESQQGESDEN